MVFCTKCGQRLPSQTLYCYNCGESRTGNESRLPRGPTPLNRYREPSRTKRGETVKSKGEKQIADYFFENGINYTYENRAETTNSAFSKKISKPDFYLPDYDVYVEYWGLIDTGDYDVRNKYREDMEWKKRRYYENGTKFISLYLWHLKDLDGAFRNEFESVMKREFVKGALQSARIRALPVSPNFREVIQASAVSRGLELADLRLEYRPCYLVSYDCFAQTIFVYERFNLESRGLAVVDGLGGQVLDVHLQSGTAPGLPRTEQFVSCAGVQPVEFPKSEIEQRTGISNVSSTAVKLQDFEAEDTVRREIARTLATPLRRQTKEGRLYTKTIRPGIKDVRTSGTKLQHIPLVTATFKAKDRSYERVLQATTNRLIADDLRYCNTGQLHYSEVLVVCPSCGVLACEEHSKRCSVCKRQFCLNHVRSGGTLFKKYFCSDHSR